MAFLVPLLLPHIVEAGANIGIGISNAIQGDSSSVSFQIGNKVFTSRRSFNFGSLPPELRMRIILEALESSKSYIQPAPFIIDPMAARMYEIQRQIPLNSSSDNFRSIYGDRVSANGYPISSWRWQYVASEWRDVLKGKMWRDVEVIGFRPWANLTDLLEGKKPPEFLRQAKTMTLKEGFQSPSDLYAVLSCPQLDNLESISILPDYPTPYHPLVPPIPTFTFGFQLIRTKKKRLSSLTYGLPLESSTNEASRQQLGVLQPNHLSLTFVRPTLALFKELSDIVGKTTDILDIRYIPNTTIVSHTMFLCDPLQQFKKVHLLLYLPRPRLDLAGIGLGTPNAPREDAPAIATFLASLLSALEAQEKEVQKRYTVTRVDNWDIPGMAEKATRTKLWPAEVLFDEDDEEDIFAVEEKGKDKEVITQRQSVPVQPAPPGERKHWERETNLRLLGGLVNLRLESKKH